MKVISSLLFLCFSICASSIFAQQDHIIPNQTSPAELEFWQNNVYEIPGDRGITSPPPFDNLRTMAEWEEIEALTIAWKSYPSILKQIARAASEECEVIILSDNVNSTQTYLLGPEAGGPLDLSNITILYAPLNTIWIRDYGQHTVYGNEVDDRFLVDWIYNRPRPSDDVTPDVIGSYSGIDVYSTTQSPNNLMNTGGNFMSDGFGTAFASELIIEENDGGNLGWTTAPNHTEQEIDAIMNSFMGIDEFIKMPTLPFDGIHHIDMHMKLIDEETILVAEYPNGIADGPQIEENITYILNNFQTKWGTPYKIVRVPSPPQSNGNYPDDGAWYLTYTNSVFINKTIIVPTYYTQYDTIALRIYEELLPGYNIVGIDCDNAGSAIISASGAIHCITKAVGVEDPLLISYPCLPNSNDDQNAYTLNAYINHRTGINEAILWYKINLNDPYTSVTMTPGIDNIWTASIPAQPFGTRVNYYVEAESNSGKTQVRPISAPEGYKSFDVIDAVFGCTNNLACNYNAFANYDDGACILPDGCTDQLSCNYNPAAICDNGSCISGLSFNLHIDTDCWGNEVSWNIRNSLNQIVYSVTGNSYDDQDSYDIPVCLIPDCYTFSIFDSYGDGMDGTASGCAIDGNYFLENNNGFVIFSMPSPNYGANELHDFCVLAPLSGCTDAEACNYDAEAVINDGTCDYSSCLGCMDPIACNFDPAATQAELSCNYPGCIDDEACNYDLSAGCDDGSCTYLLLRYRDFDGDSYGDPNNTSYFCFEFNGWVANNEDCDDSNNQIYPGAPGLGNDIDTDCSGLLEEDEQDMDCFGDLNGDGIRNSNDLLIFLANFGCVEPDCVADINNSGTTDSADLLDLLSVYGVPCP